MTPTRTFLEKFSDDASDNHAPYLGMVVTLVLGLLGVYFQYIRKRDTAPDNKNK
jgi:hypothetical protein